MQSIRLLQIPANTGLVLVKLFGLRPKEDDNIPFGRRDEAKIVAKHAELAAEVGVAPRAVRPGIIDTGRQVINNEFLDLAGLIDQCAAQGCVVSDVHWEEIADKRRPGQKKPVTVICLRPNHADAASSESIDWAKRMLMAYEFVHVWVNPQLDGTSTVTVNANHRHPAGDAPAKLEVAIETPSRA
ncbi:MAG: hypothetical protein AAB619_03570 [Patescibacteria group bacterium]